MSTTSSIIERIHRWIPPKFDTLAICKMVPLPCKSQCIIKIYQCLAGNFYFCRRKKTEKGYREKKNHSLNTADSDVCFMVVDTS